LRRLRLAVSALFAVVVIVLAVLVGITQLAMPWLIRNPGQVEAWLGRQLGREVRIGHVSGGWAGGGPAVTLDDVRLGPGPGGAAPLTVPHAQLAVDLFAPFQRNRAWNEFRLVGLDLTLAHQADGHWQLRGLDTAGGATRQSMGALGALVLRDLKLEISDPEVGLDLALAASELRVVNHGRVERVLGRIRSRDAAAPPLDLVADIDPAAHSGRVYLGGEGLDLAQLPQHPLLGVTAVRGHGSVQLWANWTANRLDDVRARVNLDDATFGSRAPVVIDAGTRIAPLEHFDTLTFAARWLGAAGGWDLDVADLVSSTGGGVASAPGRVSVHVGAGGRPAFRAGARDVAFGPLAALAMLSSSVPEGLRRWLYLAAPSGRRVDASIHGAGAADYHFSAHAEALRLGASGTLPGVNLAAASVTGDNQAILLELPARPLEVDVPQVFRKPLRFSEFGGDVVVFRSGNAWRVGSPGIAFEGEGYGGRLAGHVDIQDDGTRPLLDLYASVTHADASAAKLFWPIHVMPPAAVEWLDRALVEGAVSNGRAAIRGDLDDWPFANAAGRFAARARVDDLILDYQPGWPRAEQVGVVADFVDTGLHARVDAGTVRGVDIDSAEATIADLGETVLELSVKGHGSGPALLGFLRATPIGHEHADALDGVSIGGKAALGFNLDLPVHDITAIRLDGRVDLDQADLDDRRYDLHLDQASGPVRFDQGGFAAGPLATRLEQHPVTLALAAGDLVEDSGTHALEASLDGHLPASVVFAKASVLQPALAHFPGASDWRITLGIGHAAPGTRARVRLGLHSDLAGTAIDLPPPLAKAPAEVRPFDLALDLPYEGAAFDARLGTMLAVRGRLPSTSQALAARVELGGAAVPDPPPAGVFVGGRADQVDLGGWLDLAGASTTAGDGVLAGMALAIGDLVFAGRHFADTKLNVTRDAARLDVGFDGADLAGHLRLPASSAPDAVIEADFDRFHWPEAPAAASTAVPASVAGTGIAPGSLPPLRIKVADFRLGRASFGSAGFDSEPTAAGMHIARLETRSPNITMTASGDWTGSAAANSSHLVIDLSAHNLGHMMDALGFAGLIDGGKTEAKIDAVWPGPPSAFALADLTGSLSVKVGEGRILDVEPGAGGRLFGLLSLREIPRRLSLDFSDFFRSGLGFNSIAGSFRLADGNAWTDDLAIKSPAARIEITGRTGLRARDYDQQMTVSPHAGATLPVVGAIAGGPVGAAAGLVIQGLLSKSIGAATQSRYRVTGSWDKPVITLIGKGKTAGELPARPLPGPQP
jgi:uncharacterized protein (TIGR02099 family)